MTRNIEDEDNTGEQQTGPSSTSATSIGSSRLSGEYVSAGAGKLRGRFAIESESSSNKGCRWTCETAREDLAQSSAMRPGPPTDAIAPGVETDPCHRSRSVLPIRPLRISTELQLTEQDLSSAISTPWQIDAAPQELKPLSSKERSRKRRQKASNNSPVPSGDTLCWMIHPYYFIMALLDDDSIGPAQWG
eukprot:Skav218935  [mRNA]  locus=scaffold678:131301:134359:+ [translate_table: standard]